MTTKKPSTETTENKKKNTQMYAQKNVRKKREEERDREYVRNREGREQK